ncbi:MAG: isoprenyl transferase [Erysipelotrichaceae bacterium]
MDLKHIAIIMDGNGRWAKKHHKIRTFGHLHGTEKVREIAIAANDDGIKVLTLYAFSTENWKRPAKEVEYLMGLPAVFFDRYLRELMDKNIRIESIGNMSELPPNTRDVLSNAIKQTQLNTGMILCFAMNYGSRKEIVEAAKRYHQAVNQNEIKEDITEEDFESFLMTSQYPPVDVCIRTSGEQRLSNFLLWQLAYAELVFTQTTWPDFSAEELHTILMDVSQRERRFGGL